MHAGEIETALFHPAQNGAADILMEGGAHDSTSSHTWMKLPRAQREIGSVVETSGKRESQQLVEETRWTVSTVTS
ncbi:hypothetical protein Pstu01_28350 [Stutzerimonas stutzeri]|nr:hypothetical protein Pstu01_28350 [Stutzerimonas stutzeri]